MGRRIRASREGRSYCRDVIQNGNSRSCGSRDTHPASPHVVAVAGGALLSPAVSPKLLPPSGSQCPSRSGILGVPLQLIPALGDPPFQGSPNFPVVVPASVSPSVLQRGIFFGGEGFAAVWGFPLRDSSGDREEEAAPR